MTINSFPLSPEQLQALQKASDWLLSGTKKQQVFRIFGPAGTGKTTLAKHLAAQVDNDVAYAAFTAKAALVMKQNGCSDASTIHALIYNSRFEAGKHVFELDECSQAGEVKLIIIDECSMVDAQIARDLRSFGTPILVLGDLAQLPPVNGHGYFMQKAPEILLREIHRQSAGNPILKLADDVRNGRGLIEGNYGASAVARLQDLTDEDLLEADQILVGKNVSRRYVNNWVRDLLGFTSPLPMAGDRLVSLKNRLVPSYVNGEIFTVLANTEEKNGKMKLTLRCEDRDGTPTIKSSLKTEDFLKCVARSEDAPKELAPCFDYAYALTVHKAQGSQWRHVLIIDDGDSGRENADKWLYTAITRAQEKVKIFI